ncbi:hypothetical protein C9374_003600 [Naegleria lovaniensis]|uniref:protein disulfide-isomerase n=1 Tax=Naegleria lovaniensis TaxID=51637 RepID=A0AA88H7G1_NAELO|nr:uncharacterized protein C9374_003600 [Naegleria lovaniensis]KAG2393836.1 hypothetical protein C9374_003600 [Naegleria lovaniensis]
MKNTLVCVLVLALIAFICFSSSESVNASLKPQSRMRGVKELTSRNFNSYIKKHKYVLVEFYAPWCPHSIENSRNIQRLGKRLLDSKNFKVAKINGDRYNSIAKQVNLDGFPTVYLFVDGKKVEYKGYSLAPRKVVKWARKQIKQ